MAMRVVKPGNAPTNIPRNKPHYDVYLRTLTSRRDIEKINSTFEIARSVFGDDRTIWQLYLGALAQTRSIGDPFAMDKASQAYNLFPESKNIFTLYKWLTYGQDRVNRAAQASARANELYNNGNYEEASIQFAEALDLDPLESGYGLNAGLSDFEAKYGAISYGDGIVPDNDSDVYSIEVTSSNSQVHPHAKLVNTGEQDLFY